MFDSPVSKLSLFLSALFSLVIIYFIFSFPSKDKIVFCDVGQGDAAYIRLNNQTDILVDAGPNRKILDCLGKHMPFFDRTIELAILSHPQNDHYGGFLSVLDRYDINNFWLNQVYNSTKSYKLLLDKIDTKGIFVSYPKAGEKSILSEASITVFWPNDEYIYKNTVVEKNVPYPLRLTGLDLNNFSLIFSLETKLGKVLFTGDVSPSILSQLVHLNSGSSDQSKFKSQILKIPHHGSKNGLNLEFLKLADPTYGVISVGRNNSYGHPSRIILEMLEAQKVKTRRTDIEEDIVFKLNHAN